MNVLTLPIEAALESLRSDWEGLSSAESERRLRAFGPNQIERAERPRLLRRASGEVTHFFAVILWVAAALAVAADLGDPGQGMRPLALAIVAVILVNGVFSFWQAYQAEEAFRALQRLLPHEVTAMRDGAAARVAAESLVPGDIILLDAGDAVPADARILQAFGARVDASTITGESYPVARRADPPDDAHEALHAPNALLAGTTLVSGSARALVFATGMRTEFGRIAGLAQATEDTPSPLQRELAQLSRTVARLAIAAGLAVFVIGEALGRSRTDNFIFAIGIIVANVPEGLLPTLTLALAMASRRMARRRVLVRRLAGVEALGAATVICTDKTGTLTANRMQVRTIWWHGGEIDPAESGDRDNEALRYLLEGSRRCHDLKDTGRGGEQRWLGDPMEQALVDMATAHGVTDAPKLDEIGFDADRKRLLTVHRTSGGPVIYVKGALETVLPRCSRLASAHDAEPLTPLEAGRVTEAQSQLAARGLRVLAFAHRRLTAAHEGLPPEDDLVLDGLVGLDDPPRAEVPAAIARCRDAAIRVIIVTGDHALTAVAIGRRIGLFGARDPLVVTGDQIRRMSDAEMWAALEAPDVVFARVAADQKLRIVTTLQRHQAVVAVTGDGTNDAPALRAADVGVAMGVAGTDVAKQAADMVLLDDSFASIVAAIEEGRAVYDNIRKFLTYILTSNVPELVPYLAFAFFQMPLALTILQILAVDLGTDLVPALALGAEPPEPDVMARPPRTRGDRVLTPALLARAYVWLGGLESLVAMTAFAVALPRVGYPAATTACLGGIVGAQIVNVHLCRSERRSIRATLRRPNRLIALGIAVELVLLVGVVYTPIGQAIFATSPLPADVWWLLLPLLLTMLGAEEGRKWVVRRLKGPSARPRVSPAGSIAS